MLSSDRKWLNLLVGMALAGTAIAADPPSVGPNARQSPAAKALESSGQPAAAGSPSGPAKPPAMNPSKALSLEALKTPAGAVIVICKEAKDALTLIPQAILLSPEKYQALVDRIEQLERQIKAAKPIRPSSCKLSGRVAGDMARLHAEFGFVTHQPNELVALGCLPKAYPRSATLDGHLPALIPGGDDGVVVEVDQPGEHKLTMELELLVAPKGSGQTNEQGFDFALPRAAITELEQWTLPGRVPAVRVNGRVVQTKPAGLQHSRLVALPPLGPVDHLELIWKGPVPSPASGPVLLAAEAQIAVHIEETQVSTEAEMVLQVLRGETNEWHLLVPFQTQIECKDDRVQKIELPSDPKKPLLTIYLKEPSARPLAIKLRVRQIRGGDAVAVGPFSILQAVRQQGMIVVSAPPSFRLRYHSHGDVSQQPIPADKWATNGVAAFSYWNLPPGPIPALEVQVEPVKGAIETRVSHVLSLEPKAGWRVKTVIDVTPIRTGVDRLDIEVPANYQFYGKGGVSPAEVVETPVKIDDLGRQGRVMHIKLAQEQRSPFSIAFQGLYAVPQGQQRSSLELPRPRQGLDRGGSVEVALPPGLELVDPESAPEAFPPGTREHIWQQERMPVRAELAWRPYRPELSVDAVVDLTLSRRKASVQERFRFPQKPPDMITLDVPKSLAGHVSIMQGGRRENLGPTGIAHLHGQAFTLEYAFRLPDPSPGGAVGRKAERSAKTARRFAVPLVRLKQATSGETKVRVWSEPGVQPVLAAGPWEELRTEVTEKPSLPALVLRSASLHGPLFLSETEPSEALLASVVIDRALIQVNVGQDGRQTYRARFRVNRLAVRSLDVTLPPPAARLNPQVYLAGKRVTHVRALAERQILRVPVQPELYTAPVILDIRYEVLGQASQGNNTLQAMLYPPVVDGGVFLGRVRWQVELPSSWIPLYQDSGSTAGQAWERQGALWAPHPAVTTAELEGWLGVLGSSAAKDNEFNKGQPSLVCWRTALEPLRLIHVPQPAWLLACSLVFLVLGLGLVMLPLPRSLVWAGVILSGLAAALAGICWPSIVPAVLYGCEPGAVALILILAVQWMLHRRYRRQVVFLPGFTRLKAGSSLLHGGNITRPRAEPSTVDVAPPQPSEIREQGVESKTS